MTNPMTDERAINTLRAAACGSRAARALAHASLDHIAARLAQPAVPALDVFRIAGGDVECNPEPTAQEALDCLRNLRECYGEVLHHVPLQQPAEAVAWLIVHESPGFTSTRMTIDSVSADFERRAGAKVEPLYTAPQPPAIPEPSEEDVDIAVSTRHEAIIDRGNTRRSAMKAALTTDRARLRAKLCAPTNPADSSSKLVEPTDDSNERGIE